MSIFSDNPITGHEEYLRDLHNIETRILNHYDEDITQKMLWDGTTFSFTKPLIDVSVVDCEYDSITLTPSVPGDRRYLVMDYPGPKIGNVPMDWIEWTRKIFIKGYKGVFFVNTESAEPIICAQLDLEWSGINTIMQAYYGSTYYNLRSERDRGRILVAM